MEKIKTKIEWLCLTLNLNKSFAALCVLYFGSILVILICFNLDFTIETNLPIKELADLNLDRWA